MPGPHTVVPLWRNSSHLLPPTAMATSCTPTAITAASSAAARAHSGMLAKPSNRFCLRAPGAARNACPPTHTHTRVWGRRAGELRFRRRLRMTAHLSHAATAAASRHACHLRIKPCIRISMLRMQLHASDAQYEWSDTALLCPACMLLTDGHASYVCNCNMPATDCHRARNLTHRRRTDGQS